MTTGTRTRPARRGDRRGGRRTSTTPQRGSQRNAAQRRTRSSAAQKAYARRAQRSTAVRHDASSPGSGIAWRLPQSRASFVLLMMGLLIAGIGLTLWLSTQAIADSYRLESVRSETADLSERADRLQREVAREESAASLADKAKELGMVPSGHPARIVVSDSGKPKVVGEEVEAGAESDDTSEVATDEDGATDDAG